MRAKTFFSTLLAAALILTPVAGFAQGHGGGAQHHPQAAQSQRSPVRDQVMAPAQDRDRQQDRMRAPDFAGLSDDDIYGRELMSAEERNAYRKQLQAAGTREERARIEAAHRHEILVRAEQRNVNIAPPGKGIYGGALMSVEERSRYREQLRQLDSDPQARAKFMSGHRATMQARAREQGVPIESLDTSDGQ